MKEVNFYDSQYGHLTATVSEIGAAVSTGVGQALRDPSGALVALAATNGATAVDTSAACSLVVSAEHSAAHASLSVRLKSATVEVV